MEKTQAYFYLDGWQNYEEYFGEYENPIDFFNNSVSCTNKVLILSPEDIRFHLELTPFKAIEAISKFVDFYTKLNTN